MNNSFLESQSKNPVVIGILIFAAIALPLSIFLSSVFPGILYIGDVYFALGMGVSVIYVLFTIRKFETQAKTVLLIAIFGGIFVAFLMSLTLYIIILAIGEAVSLIDLFLDYIRIVIFIALLAGFSTLIIGHVTRIIFESIKNN